MGPVSFFVRANYQDGSSARSHPVALSIAPPDTLLPAMEDKPQAEGLNAIAYDDKGHEHRLVIKALDGQLKALRKMNLKAGQLRLDGFFYVAKPGFYQLAVKTSGRIKLSVNEHMLFEKHLSHQDGEGFVPMSLKPGWHKLVIDLEVSGRQFLEIVLAGDQAPLTLAGNSLGRGTDGDGE
jgi:hypothetical protein